MTPVFDDLSQAHVQTRDFTHRVGQPPHLRRKCKRGNELGQLASVGQRNDRTFWCQANFPLALSGMPLLPMHRGRPHKAAWAARPSPFYPSRRRSSSCANQVHDTSLNHGLRKHRLFLDRTRVENGQTQNVKENHRVHGHQNWNSGAWAWLPATGQKWFSGPVVSAKPMTLQTWTTPRLCYRCGNSADRFLLPVHASGAQYSRIRRIKCFRPFAFWVVQPKRNAPEGTRHHGLLASPAILLKAGFLDCASRPWQPWLCLSLLAL